MQPGTEVKAALGPCTPKVNMLAIARAAVAESVAADEEQVAYLLNRLTGAPHLTPRENACAFPSTWHASCGWQFGLGRTGTALVAASRANAAGEAVEARSRRGARGQDSSSEASAAPALTALRCQAGRAGVPRVMPHCVVRRTGGR